MSAEIFAAVRDCVARCRTDALENFVSDLFVELDRDFIKAALSPQAVDVRKQIWTAYQELKSSEGGGVGADRAFKILECIVNSSPQAQPAQDGRQDAVDLLEHALGSPRNDDGTLWINGGMSSCEEIMGKALDALTRTPAQANPEGRGCYMCGKEITKCDGGVKAGDYLDGIKPPRELCQVCVLKMEEYRCF